MEKRRKNNKEVYIDNSNNKIKYKKRSIFPKSTERVEKHTAQAINNKIHFNSIARIEKYKNASKEERLVRINELEYEWDTERVLEANASIIILIGIALGTFANRWWFLLPTAVAGFFLQHALQGWCPPLPIIRRLGIRTPSEIHKEIYALKDLNKNS
ncbi:DUF2892 domain-containing protein [Clostridium bovifaecis]|uniref:DUF2892 domain-containing protein n=1 Tax=Clostridium bovifaecis TaxID=2184719 RepID=A0A6I6EPX7_9CLOT|nr:DUF2892 domain-containing protein [Clostridium bovifaecis]